MNANTLKLSEEQARNLYLALLYGLACQSYMIVYKTHLTDDYVPYIYTLYNLELRLILMHKHDADQYANVLRGRNKLIDFLTVYSDFHLYLRDIQDLLKIPEFQDIFNYLKQEPKPGNVDDLSMLKVLEITYSKWRMDVIMKYGISPKQLPSYDVAASWRYPINFRLHDGRFIAIETILLAKIY